MELHSGACNQHTINSSGFLEMAKVGKKRLIDDATYHKLNSLLDWLLCKAAELVYQTWVLNLSTTLGRSTFLGEYRGRSPLFWLRLYSKIFILCNV